MWWTLKEVKGKKERKTKKLLEFHVNSPYFHLSLGLLSLTNPYFNLESMISTSKEVFIKNGYEMLKTQHLMLNV
jgi:hypothetical protein